MKNSKFRNEHGSSFLNDAIHAGTASNSLSSTAADGSGTNQNRVYEVNSRPKIDTEVNFLPKTRMSVYAFDTEFCPLRILAADKTSFLSSCEFAAKPQTRVQKLTRKSIFGLAMDGGGN
ncbi:MAG: hypothetical protein P1P65_06960 [Treponema sp.]